MCGIAGKLHWGSDVGNTSVARMCEKMLHRGPDGGGILHLPEITLGQRRLAIIDLSENGKQPMSTHDDRFHITYNGEVYNFQELKKELVAHYPFKSTSDTEVLLYAYQHWGIDFVKRLNGMFALVIWDDLKKELFIARDRFGQKPLYYYRMPNGGIAFASELNALLEDESIPRNISYEALNHFLAIGYILAPLSVYQEVKKLEAAHYIHITNGGKSWEQSRYWDYAASFRNKTELKEKGIIEKLQTLIEKAVERRLISDVPVGAFLSGGIDSSSVVATMKKFHQGKLHTFSMGFEQDSYNELPDAQLVADFVKTVHHTEICSVNKGDYAYLDKALDAFGEPFADNSLIPMLEVSRIAREQVTVSLSGDGADEFFAGYITYNADRLYHLAQYCPAFIRKMILAWAKKGATSGKLNFKYKLKQFLHGTLATPRKAHYLWRIIHHPEERIKILGEQYRDLVYASDPYHIFEQHYKEVKDLHWLDQHLYVDAKTWMADDILVKVDRTTMQHSLEARCPYLDVDLVSFAASIPANLKLKGSTTKYILKKALKGILPDTVLFKKKAGFNAPTGDWIGQDGADEFKAFNRYVYAKKIKKLTQTLVKRDI